MAVSYAGARKSKYGSWGHLETFAQSALTLDELRTVAPKYATLLEVNTPRLNSGVGARQGRQSPSGLQVRSVVQGRIRGVVGRVEIRSIEGRVVHRGELSELPQISDGLVLVRPIPTDR